MFSDSKNVWAKMRLLTGRSRTTTGESHSSAIIADSLNKHYGAISTDAEFVASRSKCSANAQCVSELVAKWRVFNMLEALRPTATGLDDLPALFLKVGAPFFAAPIADMFNLSLSTSVVPNQWKAASISPVPKIPKPLTPADYRLISITPVRSRVMERIVVRDHRCNSHPRDCSLMISSRFGRLAQPLRHSSSYFTMSPLCSKPTRT